MKKLVVITRSEAKAKGLTRYFTGKPCKRGHLSERRVSSLCCLECDADRSRRYYKENREDILTKKRVYRSENYEKERKREAEYSKRNRDARRAYSRMYGEENKEYFTAYNREYYRTNKRKILDANNSYARMRRKHDPGFRMMESMRKMLSRVMERQNTATPRRTEIIIGYTRNELVAHLESQFQEGMSWNNYGKWHIDHIIPIDHFIKSGERNPAVINALENLQPLWAQDNLSKGNRLIQEEIS